MKILIMRHGDAVIDIKNDMYRPLTNQGQYESILIAKWLNNRMIDIDRVLVSSYLRALQTLDLLYKHLTLPDHKNIIEELSPYGNIKKILYYFHTMANEGIKCVLVISHLPMIKKILLELCPNNKLKIFNTSTIVSIEMNIDIGINKFNWKIEPTQLLHENLKIK